ncbi:hypothetical protein [Cellulomonas sp. URHE0023]|uniref:hypothetical protein n=1 Tax=Cellulomonas sp. URHE0023 TaxID=1380354 RepID=UPI0004820EC1|nr:hypothetical protein [Cellulomonas sp. URHE0023]
MTVTDGQLHVDPELEAQVRREHAGATWFELASATAKAHRAYDEVRRQHDDAVTARARGRLHVLELLLAAETDRLHPLTAEKHTT